MRISIALLPTLVVGIVVRWARALYLGNTIYSIHGTNNDRTVGRKSARLAAA